MANMAKRTVAVLYGGDSPEHDVSLRSAASILREIDRQRFDIIKIAVTKKGEWYLDESDDSLITDGRCFQESGLKRCFLTPDKGIHGIAVIDGGSVSTRVVDAVFPVLHGANGEDGTIQGLCALAGVPCVGSGVLGSAMCMDKPVAKVLFSSVGIDNTPWLAVSKHDYETDPAGFLRAVTALGYPVFVKPADAGSSVGAGRARDEEALHKAVATALLYSGRVLVERCVEAREIECAVFGNEEPVASCLGEIEPVNEFYDYEAKYIASGSKLIVPAPLPEETQREIRDKAVLAYKTLRCAGLARVDFFVERATGRVLLNEINTIPGFTSISMYPRLMEHSGMGYGALVTGLIELAMAKKD